MNEGIATYIIHVDGAQERKAHMDVLLSRHLNLLPTFITDGNIKDLSKSILENYFLGEMKEQKPATSCAYKHFLALKEASKQEGVSLILEDDIDFYTSFDENLTLITEEIKLQGYNNFIVNLEDSLPRYVAKSIREKGKFLYPKNEMRLAGAYLVDSIAAKKYVEKIVQDKIHLPTDWFLNTLIQEGSVKCYWSHPVLACQKSLSGHFPSLIDQKAYGKFRQLNFWIQKQIKRFKSLFR